MEADKEDKRATDLSRREAFAVSEFCDRYGICRETFYQEVRRGRLRARASAERAAAQRRLRARKLGMKTIVLRADADAWVATMPALELSTTA